jgi:gliding motility-associated-like protein
MLGLFVVGIRVQELRNGVVINQTTRDFLFRVFNCELQLEAIVPEQEDMAGFVSFCNGLTVNFDNNSYGGTNYSWDFGVNGTNNDVSNAFEPTFTYPGPGNYQAMLVVNPGWPCTDTSFVDIYVNNELEVSFTSNDSLCVFGNSFDFVAASNGPPTTIYNWDFGPNTATPNAVGQTVNGINFTATGEIEITVEGVDGLCVNEFTETIYIFPEPIAEINVPNEVECEGLDIQFQSNSQNSNSFEWDFGDTQTSTEEDPLHNFAGPGTYLVTLISGSTASCKDTTSVSITINDPLIVSFTSQDSLCITDNSFYFDVTVSGPPNSVFTWNFGPSACILTSTDEDVNDVVFSSTGSIPITLTGTFDNCVESVTESIYIFQPPTIDFALLPGLQCAPFEAQFVDQSFAETAINYIWDFGDNTTSNEQNPVHLYPNVGAYSVTLNIWTEDGCIDTLFKIEPDLVNVRPNPVAGFSMSPTETDICHSLVEFTDESQGASIYSYTYGDGTEQSGESNPAHVYLTDGNMYPIQFVENEFGCKDSVRGHVFIEPFPLYIPNTFTPDGNEFNNTFKPSTYLDVFEWNMKIYNRWGHVVFETNDFDIGWDGTMPNGFMAPDGVYLYTIEMETCEPIDPIRVLNGHVSILR